MTAKSAKAKGRSLQNLVAAKFYEIGKDYGLDKDDITGRPMGQNGTDIVFTPAARKIFGVIAVECKNVETLNIVKTFNEHAKKYLTATPLLVHKKNGTEPLVTIRLTDYMSMLEELMSMTWGGGALCV